jgi:hypothetical protein
MHRTHCSNCGDISQVGGRFCPHCGGRLEAAPAHAVRDETEALEDSEEIRLDELAATDCVLIRTRNTVYRFTVLEAARGRGLLSGGTLGEAQARAVAPREPGARAAAFGLPTLRTGEVATFRLGAGKAAQRLTTSPITRLTCIRGGHATRPLPS